MANATRSAAEDPSPDRESSSGRRPLHFPLRLRLDLPLVALSLLLLGSACLAWRHLQADDAYITFRYAKNLAQGLGAVFNPGERVEGYSNPLWMWLIAGGFRLDLEPMWLARRLSLLGSVAVVVVLYRGLVRAGAASWGAALTTFLFTSSLFVQMSTMSGLETMAYTALFFSGLVVLGVPALTRSTACWGSALLVLAALMRPEGVAYWGMGLLLVALVDRRQVIVYALPGALIVAHLAWRLSYYGDLLPNTFYAKASSAALWPLGIRELTKFLGDPPALAVVVLACTGALAAWRAGRARRAVWLLGGTTAFHLLYTVSVGGDAILMNRFQVMVLPSLAFLAGLLFLHDLRPRALAAAGVLGIVCATGVSVHQLLTDPPQVRVEWLERCALLGKKLKQTRSPDTLIAVLAVGIIPYYAELPTLDLLGLNDPHIAHVDPTDQPERAAPGHMKWDIDYVLAREPDLIIQDVFVPNEAVPEIEKQPLRLIRGPMWEELYGRLRWNEDYEHHAIDLGDGHSVFVFERREGAGRAAPTQGDGREASAS